MGLKLKNKGQTNFYECCDLTKKVYLMYTCLYLIDMKKRIWSISGAISGVPGPTYEKSG